MKGQSGAYVLGRGRTRDKTVVTGVREGMRKRVAK